MSKKLFKSRTDVKVDGVCAGVAKYFGFDVTMVRIVWLLAVILGASAGFWIYLVCAIVMPREPEFEEENVTDYRDYPNQN